MKQNQCLDVLAKFDSKDHYLSIGSNNQFVLCKKADLNWASRIVRWFWKPENERVTYITMKIFEHLGKNIPQQLNGNCDLLKRVFKQLLKLSENADLRLKKIFFKEKVFELQNVSFGEQTLLDVEENFKIKKKEGDAKLADLQERIKKSTDTFEILLANNDALSKQVATKDSILKTLEMDIKPLELKKNRLDFDTVLWTNEGYLLCSTAFFKESMLNAPSFKTMTKMTQFVENKLRELEFEEPEKSNLLRMIPQHLYLQDTKIKHVKMLLTLLELGSGAIDECTKDDHDALQTLSDFLLIEIPDLKILQVKEELNKLKEEFQKKNEKLLRLQKENEIQAFQMNNKNRECLLLNDNFSKQSINLNDRNQELGQLKKQLDTQNQTLDQLTEKIARKSKKYKELKKGHEGRSFPINESEVQSQVEIKKGRKSYIKRSFSAVKNILK